MTPYYNKATQKGLIDHFTMVAQETTLPVIMYNVPSRTGTNIQPKTAVEIAKRNRNVIGIKDAAANLAQTGYTMHLAREAGVTLDIYSGNDDEVLPVLSVGGIGVISVLSNVMPRETHDMVYEYLHGDRQKAMDIQLGLLPLIKALFCEVNPIPVKTALNLMGKNVGPLRMPLCDMDPQNLALLKSEMHKVGLI